MRQDLVVEGHESYCSDGDIGDIHLAAILGGWRNAKYLSYVCVYHRYMSPSEAFVRNF